MNCTVSPSFISPNYTNNRLSSKKFIVKSSLGRNESRNLFRVRINHSPFRNVEPKSITVICRSSSSSPVYDNDDSKLNSIAKHVVYAVFFVAIGILPIFGVRVPVANAASPVQTALSWFTGKRNKGRMVENEANRHLYSNLTDRLLGSVSSLLRAIDEVESGRASIDIVKERIEDVRTMSERLQQIILNDLSAKTRGLWRERRMLLRQINDILRSVLRAKMEEESLLRTIMGKGQKGKGETERLYREINRNVLEHNRAWSRIAEIDGLIAKRETTALSMGVHELVAIENECVALVETFLTRIEKQKYKSMHVRPLTKLSRSDIKETLQNSQRQLLKQRVINNVLGNEGIGFDEEIDAFAQRIKQALQESHEVQRNLESDIRKKMKKYGDEKKLVVNTPVDEVVKGFPEFRLKWMFGKKELVVPNAVATHLYHGWKKWREEVKGELKRNLLENAEFRRKYITERQELILQDRDRVVARTWYNEERHRWEMDPIAVTYAVSRKLVKSARIRHDWAFMFINLKGDDKEYCVDIKELDFIFEEFGGFDGLYLRMLSSKVPTTVQLMWIPFFEMKFQQQFLLVANLCGQCLAGLWNTNIASKAREWVSIRVRDTTDDIMMMIGFPLLEFVIPYAIRSRIGMAWPMFSDQSASSSWYLKWQSIAERNFEERKKDGFLWFLWFLIRTTIYVYVLCFVVGFTKRKISRIIGYGPLRRDPNLRKLKRLKAYLDYRRRRIKRKKGAGYDPINTAFDHMKRIKNPPIRLKDFASIDSMKEEINEVVAFLQNPRAFQEMGARAPRGVLIVGERGTGKTSLAMAIAAESKVPVVEIKAQQLEGNMWVGQSASNVRELFQTARDLAPVIIFVEDFDLFAGVRGKFIHNKKQDHEAFINQLLVELDGFEKQDGVVLMATTRNLSQIDEALQRPGRMDRIFHLQRPTQAERENILKIAAKETMDEELIDYVDWRKVAEKTALLRPIELKLVPVALEGSAFRSKFLDKDELMSYCSWFATFSGFVPNWVRKTGIGKKFSKSLINHLGLTVTKGDLENVVDLMEPYGQISNGIEYLNPPVDWTRETKLPHAVWAAGRSLIALLLPNFDVVDNLWLESCSWEGIGCTKITKARNEGSINGNVESRSYLEKKLVFCFGSYISAQLLLPFGEDNVLSSSELKQAQEIATRMVIQYGWGPDDSPTIYHHGKTERALSMGNTYEHEMAAKVENMYYLAYEKARTMLQRNRRVLEKIVEELLDNEILTGKDLERILAQNGGTREKEPFFLSDSHYEEPVLVNFLEENGNASATAFLTAAN